MKMKKKEDEKNMYNTGTNMVEAVFRDDKEHLLVIKYKADKYGVVEKDKTISFTKNGIEVPRQ